MRVRITRRNKVLCKQFKIMYVKYIKILWKTNWDCGRQFIGLTNLYWQILYCVLFHYLSNKFEQQFCWSYIYQKDTKVLRRTHIPNKIKVYACYNFLKLFNVTSFHLKSHCQICFQIMPYNISVVYLMTCRPIYCKHLGSILVVLLLLFWLYPDSDCGSFLDLLSWHCFRKNGLWTVPACEEVLFNKYKC